MRKNDPVSHVMTKDPVVLEAGDSLSRARRLFEETGVHHLPVVRGGELAGILSWTDFLRVSFGEFGNQDVRSLDAVLDHTRRLQDVMRTDVITMPISGTVRDAAAILSQGGFHSVPAVNRNSALSYSAPLQHAAPEFASQPLQIPPSASAC